jgi:hypothetical protein
MDGRRTARRRLPALSLAFAAVLAAACQAPTTAGPTTAGPTTAGAPAASSTSAAAARSANPNRTVPVTDNTWTDATDPAAIPLGDNKYVTTPEVGHLDSCQTSFPPNGGATSSGSWLDAAAGTRDSETKPAVEGSVTWSKTTYSVKTKGSRRVITTADLPKGEPTGTFPISASDPASRYDQNPNSVVRQKLTYRIPDQPVAASAPSCTSLGAIGVLDDGVVLLNALDAEGRDAAAHELLDRCDGHPMMAGMYHYHVVSPCLMPTSPSSATLVGYALDGYGIYVERNASGNLPTDADLDACHGRTSEVLFNNTMVDMYHYDATLEYPYTVGCYHGTPAASTPMP